MTGLAKAGSRESRVMTGLDRLSALTFARTFCLSEGASLIEVIGRSREPRIVRARHHLWAVLFDTLGLGYAEHGRLFEVDHTTVMHAIEKRRAELASEVAA